MRAFCTAINCMDGRVQMPVVEYLRGRFNSAYVDMVTEPGPNAILAKRENPALVHSILNRVNISIEKHDSVGIAIVAHHDCAGNPASNDQQLQHLHEAVEYLQRCYELPIIALWVDENWQVNEMESRD